MVNSAGNIAGNKKSDTDSINGTMVPGDINDPFPKISFFGVDRYIENFNFTIRCLDDEDSEYCGVYSCMKEDYQEDGISADHFDV